MPLNENFFLEKTFIPIDGANIVCQDHKMLSFCSHDYLGLSEHSDVKKNAIKAILQYGMSSPSYECTDLSHRLQKQCEERLAKVLCKDHVFFFPSREATNHTLLSVLSDHATLFIDASCHRSLAQYKGYNIYFFEHQNIQQLETLLKNSTVSLKIIVTESIFSLGGDLNDLHILSVLAEQFEALLYVDDSHAFGLFGKEGMGIAPFIKGVDFISGSLNKACGIYGGYLACSKIMRDFLLHHANESFVHHLPSAVIGGLEAALDLIPQMDGERQQLQQRAHFLRTQLQNLQLEIVPSNTALISIIFQTEDEAEDLRIHLFEADIFVAPPHVLNGNYLLQFVVTSSHMPDHLNILIESIKMWKEALAVN